VRISKNSRYETPFVIIGNNVQTGLKDLPKDIYAKIELSERGKLTTLRTYFSTKC
jgi:hypothetical protein